MNLHDFLCARLDEDAKRAPLSAEVMGLRASTAQFGARLLRDIESKRRMVRHLDEINLRDDWPMPARNLAAYTMRLLALPYDNHPDYRKEWRP